VHSFALCCGETIIDLDPTASRQLEARVLYSDGSRKDVAAVATWTSSNPVVAKISSTGALTGLQFGEVQIAAVWENLRATWNMRVDRDRRRPPKANEMTGKVRELTALFPIEARGVQVEVVGGPNSGLAAQTDSAGRFWFYGLEEPGFDLVFRRRGYVTARVRVPELGREVRIDLSPGEGHIADVVEAPKCSGSPTLTRTFTPRAAGVLQLTSHYQTGTRQLYADGALLSRNLQVGADDIELRAGVKYELRATGQCAEYGAPDVWLAFLRPAG
jgi:hypothetical protein